MAEGTAGATARVPALIRVDAPPPTTKASQIFSLTAVRNGGSSKCLLQIEWHPVTHTYTHRLSHH
jgi:hypothetical protein